MTEAVSDTPEPKSPASPGEPPSAPSAPIFRAFVERKPSRLRWALPALLLLAGGGIWAITGSQPELMQVPTPRGIISVRQGMTPTQVQDVLGRPVTVERSADGRTECYRHGQPTLEKPSFRIYSACYEEGELRALTVKQYEAWEMDATRLPPSTDETKAPL